MQEKKYETVWPWILLGLFLFIICILYLIQFHSFPWSQNPGDWGTIGDYFGGMLNPLVSALALFFLIKAYVTQKEELRETRRVLEETEKSNKKLSESQEKLVAIQYLMSIINCCYQKIEYLHKELSRCTDAIVNNRNTIDREGNDLNTDKDTKNYRFKLIKEINELNKSIEKLTLQLNKYEK